MKWCFNIKPDLVLQLEEVPPLVIEAKLWSPEACYPTGNAERRIFKRREISPVRQRDLQEFMFRVVLSEPARHLAIGRTAPPHASMAFLAWSDVFAAMDTSASLPFVHDLAAENRHIRGSTVLPATSS